MEFPSSPGQNIRQVGPGVYVLLSYKQTDKQTYVQRLQLNIQGVPRIITVGKQFGMSSSLYCIFAFFF